jgi:hypothetical protein
LAQRLKDIREWLSPPDPSTNLNAALDLRHPGSGQWFLQGSEFATWRKVPNSFLWLNGKPGCGKSILSSTIIENLKGALPDAESLLYFYFDFREAEKQSLGGALRSLVYQLYRQSPNVQKYLHSLFSSCNDGKQQPSITLLGVAFEQMIEKAGDVWIVLDALDECQPQQRSPSDALLTWIHTLRNLQAKVHLLATSRPEQRIQSIIAKWARESDIITIRSSLVEADICQYIQTRVREQDGLSRWRGRLDVQNEIESALMEKSDGM